MNKYWLAGRRDDGTWETFTSDGKPSQSDIDAAGYDEVIEFGWDDQGKLDAEAFVEKEMIG